MKKSLSALCAITLVLTMGGCKKEETPPPAPKEEQVAIIKNEVYEAPVNPNNVQAKAYNELTGALKGKKEDKDIAGLVANMFILDFFSLSNKASADEIGGMTYLPKDKAEEFKDYAKLNYYAQYPMVVNEYSKEDLPCVNETKLNFNNEVSLVYKGQVYDGYEVSYELTYATTKVEAAKLKKTVKISIIKIDDVLRVIKAE
ncbi:MAG: ferrichrome ABC transporter substrate-binding protein [Erysipelotrichaceae bacterium]